MFAFQFSCPSLCTDGYIKSAWNDHRSVFVCVCSFIVFFFLHVFFLAHPTSALRHSEVAIVPRELGRAMKRWEEGRSRADDVICLQSVFSFHPPLSWTKGLGEGDNVTKLSWGKVIYCSLSADSRTLQVPYRPEAAANDALQLTQGHGRCRRASTITYLPKRLSNKCT